ncbi:MAG: hypothetical protein LBJ02_05190 [Bifidobacteriaceae bacterium]|jgi:hypothetical protein|nr:hypothetical protein [Bifidobacteriaceae bacterium]
MVRGWRAVVVAALFVTVLALGGCSRPDYPGSGTADELDTPAERAPNRELEFSDWSA